MVGRSDAGRVLTLVIERTIEPTNALLATIDSKYVERHGGDPAATVRIVLSVEGEDARRLERIAEARGKTPHDVVAELLRDADGSPA
jgi:uncharacterized Fe-S cluster-containing radical SAM superfamily protein